MSDDYYNSIGPDVDEVKLADFLAEKRHNALVRKYNGDYMPVRPREWREFISVLDDLDNGIIEQTAITYLIVFVAAGFLAFLLTVPLLWLWLILHL